MTATTATTWYHGTSTATGMESGDWIDPRRGAFEGGVWATSSLALARQWARSADAVHEGGEPIVFEIEISGDAVEVEADEEEEAPEADLVVVRNGEGRVPNLFVRGRFSASVGRVVA